jgi:hypothetical protein
MASYARKAIMLVMKNYVLIEWLQIYIYRMKKAEKHHSMESASAL